MRELQTQGTFAVQAQAMLSILTSAELVEDHHRLQGALEVKVEELQRSDTRMHQRVSVKEYWRNMKGVDHKRIENAVIDYHWQLDRLACTWSYRGARGEQVQLSGRIWIEEQGSACRVYSAVKIKVPVPLLGRLIEKRIAQDVQAGFEPFRKLLQEFCDKEDRP